MFRFFLSSIKSDLVNSDVQEGLQLQSESGADNSGTEESGAEEPSERLD